MYTLDQISTVHLEITSRCQAGCPMCARNIQGLDNPWLELKEISIEQFKKWFPIPFIKQLQRLYMCGNLGDPIVAKDTLEIFQYLRNENASIQLGMNTNGSARDSHWWKELARLNVRTIFGIDGLQDTHAMYRIGTDYNKILDNAETFISAGGKAEWHMLIFQHNQHQVEQCRQLSQRMGFADFKSKDTSRFREDNLVVLNKDGSSSHILYPSDKSKNISIKLSNTFNQTANISCKAVKEKSIYVNAGGLVIPCCWLDYNAMIPIHPSRIDMKDRQIEFYSLDNISIEEIFQQNVFDNIKQTWNDDPVRECKRQCGAVDKFNEQFS